MNDDDDYFNIEQVLDGVMIVVFAAALLAIVLLLSFLGVIA